MLEKDDCDGPSDEEDLSANDAIAAKTSFKDRLGIEIRKLESLKSEHVIDDYFHRIVFKTRENSNFSQELLKSTSSLMSRGYVGVVSNRVNDVYSILYLDSISTLYGLRLRSRHGGKKM